MQWCLEKTIPVFTGVEYRFSRGLIKKAEIKNPQRIRRNAEDNVFYLAAKAGFLAPLKASLGATAGTSFCLARSASLWLRTSSTLL